MIEISVVELEPLVSMIRMLNQQLTDTLLQLKSQWVMVDHYWQGDTSLMFKEKAQSLQDKIEFFQEEVERYALHLETVIENYRLTEQNLHNNIAAF